MKTYTFEGREWEETGEYRFPKKGEWFLNNKACGSGQVPSIADHDFINCEWKILRPVERKFRVGDRVRHNTGNKGVFIKYENFDHQRDDCRVRWDDGKEGICHSKNLTLLVAPDTLTIGDKTYVKLKSLSPESVYKGNPCKDEFDKYCQTFGFYHEPSFNAWFIDKCTTNAAWLPWLLSHGYIGVEERKKERKVVVIEGVFWKTGRDGFIHPDSNCGQDYAVLLNKPLMRMTLEWEE